MGTTRKRMLVLTLVALGALVLAGAAWVLFAPKPSDARDEAAPTGATLLARGDFSGEDSLHRVSGSVELLRDERGLLLRFEEYDATPGPDVYFYLTRGDAFGADAVRVPTDTPSGQATLRGSFNLRVPENVDATLFDGVTVWCDRFSVRFGGAPLR